MANAHSWQELAAVFRGRLKGLEPAWREGTREATRILWTKARANMQAEIYATPPDTVSQYTLKRSGEKALTSMGKLKKGFATRLHFGRAVTVKLFTSAPLKGRRGGRGYKWTQTGNLLRSERMRVQDAYTGLVTNATRYAHARHNLALSPGDPNVIPPPPSKKRHSTRIAPWRAHAIAETREQRLEAYRRHIVAVLRRQAA